MLILQGVPTLGASNKGGVVKPRYIRAKCVNISKTIADTPKLLLIITRKLYIRFQLAPRSMTLDDLEMNCYKFEFSENFVGFAYFGGNNC